MISLAEIATGKKAAAMIATKRVAYIHIRQTRKIWTKAAPIQLTLTAQLSNITHKLHKKKQNPSEKGYDIIFFPISQF